MGKVTMAGTGGGADLDIITAAANDVLAGKVIVGPDGEPLTGTLALTGTAADSQVLSGQTYYNTDAKTKRTGAMLTMGGQTITPGAAQQTVSCAGRYMTGNITVNAISNLTAGNIKKGVTIGGVTGTWEGYIAAANDLYYRGDNVGDIYSYSGGLLQQDRLVTQSVNYSGILSGESIFCSRKAFQVSGYSKLNMEIYLVMNTTTSTSDEYRFRFLCGSNAPGLQGTSLLKEVKTISKEGWYTITAPLIGVTGNQYFCFRVQTYSASKDFRPIFRIYFT